MDSNDVDFDHDNNNVDEGIITTTMSTKTTNHDDNNTLHHLNNYQRGPPLHLLFIAKSCSHCSNNDASTARGGETVLAFLLKLSLKGKENGTVWI